ncbi:hypothetical protein GCM10009687_73910 [Asanoa iriomotensis]|uniref:Uncharacterized protein n=1 Tax=Asanoa iriomotensis TaxID=234613 RepID=A0ABQ4CA69_9ACTN|nr:hypothetical protein Air01nite_57710 [Asanoa iriomotensis]
MQVELLPDEVAVEQRDQGGEQEDRGIEVERDTPDTADHQPGSSLGLIFTARVVCHRIDAIDTTHPRGFVVPLV